MPLAEANGNLTSLNSSFLKGMKIKKNRQPAQLADELAGVLAAAGVGPIPEGGVEGDVH